MPNYVNNIVTFRGKKEVLEKVSNYVKDFDFENFIPRPETLNIISGTETDNAKVCYIWSLFEKYDNNESNYVDALALKGLLSRIYDFDTRLRMAPTIIERYPVLGEISSLYPFGHKSSDISYLWSCENNSPKCRADFIELGRIALMNIVNYGFTDWFDWSVTNWGTKWNIDSPYLDEYDDKIVYEFETAWSMPIEIAKHIFKYFANDEIEILWEYADEDIGSNCGYWKKEMNSSEYICVSIENVEFANRIWGYEDADLDNEDYMVETNELMDLAAENELNNSSKSE